MAQVLGSSSRRALTTQERQSIDLSARIKGWGSDRDASRRPGVPRDKAPELGPELLYPPIPRQAPTIKIHKSTEHARLTPVFGTSCPPRGLSGKMRDFGYRFSEGRLARWMTLMAADRVDVAEGLLSDLAHGHIPNIPKEMGIRAELRYNRARFLRNVATGIGITAAVVACWRMRR